MSSKKRIKIELEDSEGDKYNLSLEGNFSKEKIVHIMELMDIVQSGRKPSNNITSFITDNDKEILSVDSKIWNVIEQSFSRISFTSSDIAQLYEERYKEPIKLSVISTYLSRYCTKGKLLRTKRLREYVYSLPISSSKDLSCNNSQNCFSSATHYNNLYNIDNKTIHDLKN